MVRRTLEQILNKPKRPLNPYFKMRLEMLQTLPAEFRKISIIQNEWENLDPQKKAQMYQEFETERKEYIQKMKLWRITSFDGNSTIKSDSSLNSVIEESQNSRQDYSGNSGGSKIRSLLKNQSIEQGLSKSFQKSQENQSFYLEDSQDGAIENHLLEIKRLVKKKERRWKKERNGLLNQIRAERLRSQRFQTECNKANTSLRTTIEQHLRKLQMI